eukprot:2717140-Pleurochrysis_carterae.AAC.1
MAAASHYVLLLNTAKAETNKGASAHQSESVELQLDRHSRRGRAPTASSCGRHQYGAPLRPWRYE